jgi:hypothetical protein
MIESVACGAVQWRPVALGGPCGNRITVPRSSAHVGGKPLAGPERSKLYARRSKSGRVTVALRG